MSIKHDSGYSRPSHYLISRFSHKVHFAKDPAAVVLIVVARSFIGNIGQRSYGAIAGGRIHSLQGLTNSATFS